MKTLKKQARQNRQEMFAIPRSVQQAIPIKQVYKNGVFMVEPKRYSRTYRFLDINYAIASRESKEGIFLSYGELLNFFDSSTTFKITVANRRINQQEFEKDILIPLKDDGLDVYRKEYNQMLLDKSVGADGVIRELYLTVTVTKKNAAEAQSYFNRIGAELAAHFSNLDSYCYELNANERLRILHDFYRAGEEACYHFDLKNAMQKGHSFKDYVCPNDMAMERDHFRMGDRWGRVFFLKDYANFIKDSILSDMTEACKNIMLSIDVTAIPTDEAVREIEQKLLGVETNITNWQRRQNANNNFSAVVPYDMELQRKEAKEFLEDLTTRDQRMMFATVTVVITADTKEQLEADTETLLTTARKHLCQLAVLRYQQLAGLNTVLPIGVKRIQAIRTLTTEALSVLMPFRVREVVEKGGIYCGVNAISHNLIVPNRGNLLNPSGFVLGVPGAGKSMLAKMLIVFIALATDDHILIYDPEGEYAPLIEALSPLGVAVLPIAAGSSVHLNAMDMTKGYGEKNPVIEKSQFVLTLFERVAGEGALGAKEKSILDRCVAKVYELQKSKGVLPCLPLLRKVLQDQPEPEATELSLMLELFTDGSLNIFSHESNIGVQDKRIVVYNCRDMGEELKPLGQLIITDQMINRVASNWEQGIRTHIFLDEYHTLLEHEYSANFFDSAFRRFRKRDAWVTALTQNVEYVLDSLTARTMLSNSEYITMLNQAASDRQKLAELLHISEQQLSYVTNAQAGNGLMRIGSAIVPFINQFPRDSKLYALMTTRPSDRVA